MQDFLLKGYFQVGTAVQVPLLISTMRHYCMGSQGRCSLPHACCPRGAVGCSEGKSACLGHWQSLGCCLPAARQGKRDAERHLEQTFPGAGVALRPSFIYGSRALASGAKIPLGALGAPLEAVSRAVKCSDLGQQRQQR